MAMTIRSRLSCRQLQGSRARFRGSRPRTLNVELLEGRRLLSVLTTNPVANSHVAPATAPIAATFVEPLLAESVGSDGFVVHSSFAAKLGGPLNVSESVISLSPNRPLHVGALVQVTATNSIETQEAVPISPHVWQFRVGVASGTGLFGNSMQALGASDTTDIALGDVDGDGDLDVFAANKYTNDQASRVWLNDGSGNFDDSGQRLGDFFTNAVALGDLDGDGDLDAMTANSGFENERGNRVLLNDGNGTFLGTAQRLGDSRSHAIALGDLDGDGDLDAFVGNQFFNDSRANKVWLNNGQGTFSDSEQLLGNSSTEDIALGDFDGDGDLDAYVANSRGSTDRLWLNDGQGNFHDSGHTLSDPRNDSHAVAAGDLDGDGDLDIIVGVGNRIRDEEASRVLLNDGNGMFVETDGFSGAAVDIALADFDADGDLDAFATLSRSNEVWLNDGNGRFQQTSQQLPDLRSQAVALGDLDGDGDIDAATGNRGSNKIWLNADVPFDLAVTSTNDQYFVAPGQSVTYSINVTNEGPEDASGANVTVDFGPALNQITWQCVASAGSTCSATGSGAINDTVSLTSAGAATYTVTGSLSGAAEGLIVTQATVTVDDGFDISQLNNEAEDVDRVPARQLSPQLNSHTAPPVGPISATFENDVDPASVTDDTFVIHATGTGQVTARSISVDGANLMVVPTSDFHPGEAIQVTTTNGISDVEGPTEPFVWQYTVETAAASGFFETSGQLLGAGEHQSAVLGDVDGDGDLDAVVADAEGDNQLWLNDGTGTMTDSGQTLGQLGRSVALGDLDGDRDLDVFIANGEFQGRPNRVWLNDGSGRFVKSEQQLGQARSRAVALGDLDGDGDLDAFVGNQDAANTVWVNDGNGQLSDSGQQLGEARSRGVALADVDGDGDLDAMVANDGQNDAVWFNDGSGRFDASGQRLGDSRSVAIATGDIDGDGDVDALIGVDALNSGGYDEGSRIWINGGGGQFIDSQQRLSGVSVRSVALGDIDGDGDLDAFIGRVAGGDGGSRIWFNDGQGSFTESGQILIGARGFSVPLGDLDGDGDLDAFLANVGASQVWLNQALPGDANGDGRFDRLDIVQVLQRGKFMTEEFAGWQDGDWNLDGRFDQQDLVAALQQVE